MLAQYQSVNSQAQQTAATPFQTYGTSGTSVAPDYSTGNTGTFVAPINSEQTTGIANTNTAANEAQPYYGAATGVLGATQAATQPVNNQALTQTAENSNGLSGSQINQYLSPYLGDVLGSTEALTAQQNEQAQSGALGTAISSGAFGGDRTGLAAANLQQQEDLAAGNVYSGIANTGYQSALNTAQQEQQLGLSGAAQEASIGQTAYGEGANTASELASLGSGAQTAGLQGANAQIAAGTVEQQTQQAQDTAQYNQFEQQQSYPFQVDQFLANIAEGTGALSGSTTTTQQPGGFFSDKRLKHDIKKVGETYDGQHIYSYKMHGDPRTHIGLIAQNVEKKHPEAVGLAAGYKTVDYGKATDAAANRGHFYAGGLARAAYADGGSPSVVSPGDLSAILHAQEQMYAPRSNGTGLYGGQTGSMPHGGTSYVPPPSGSVAHLVTPQGGVRPAPTGAQDLSTIMGLAGKGNDLYNGVKPRPKPATQPPAANDSQGTDPGLAGGGRIRKDSGGGLGDVLSAQDAMYQNRNGQQRNIPSTAQQHQLAVASGTPAPPPSGSSQVQQTLGLANDAYKAYNHFNKSNSTPSGGLAQNNFKSPDINYNSELSQPVNTGSVDAQMPEVNYPAGFDDAPTIDYSSELSAPVDTGTVDATMPAVDTGVADAAAPAATDAAATGAGDVAGAAVGDAAGTAVAGATEDAAADAAVDLAAEYALADAGVAAAAVAAKRGGLMRANYDTGGMPYSSASAGSPYSDTGGLNIPDDENSAKLQTAGPIQKIPTGLQDMMNMSNPNNTSSTVGTVFSNEAVARGGLIRRGYDDGGAPTDPNDPDSLDGPPQGLGAVASRPKASATADPDVTPKTTSGGLKGFWENNKGYILPAVSGLAAMGTAPTRSLGVALASGLGAAANSYVPTQQGIANTQQTQAETQGIGIENQLRQMKVDAAKPFLSQYLTPSQQPAAPSTNAPAKLGDQGAQRAAEDIDAEYRNKYLPILYTPEETQRINAAQGLKMTLGDGPALQAQGERDRRYATEVQAKQSAAQHEADQLYAQYTAAPNSPQGQAALAKYNAIHQWTGDKYNEDANKTNTRTGAPAIGAARAQLSPETRTEVLARALDWVDVPTSTPGKSIQQRRYDNAGASSPQDYLAKVDGGQLPMPTASGSTSAAPATASQAPAPQAPRPTLRAAAPQARAANSSSLPWIKPTDDQPTREAFSDPLYRTQAKPTLLHQTASDQDVINAKAMAEKRAALNEFADETAKNAPIALQYALAARQVMQSKSVPVTGPFGKIIAQASAALGGSDAADYQKLAKYLGNQAVILGQGNFPNATERENDLQMHHLSPSTDQVGDALNDLNEGNIRMLNYNLATANRATRFLDESGYNGDPQKFGRWNQAHFSRQQDYNQQPTRPGQQASGKIVTQADVDAYATKNHLTAEEALAHIQKNGFVVQ